MTREVVITFNGNKYKGLVQDSHPGDGWYFEITVLEQDGWWHYMGKGRFNIGEIHDWEWGNAWIGMTTSTGAIKLRTPLDAKFKELMERAVVQHCLDLLTRE